MNTTYQTPALTVFGSVEQLTGIVGADISTDFLVVNGNAVDTDVFGEGSTESNCAFVQSAPDSFTYIGSLTGQERQDCIDEVNAWDGVDRVN